MAAARRWYSISPCSGPCYDFLSDDEGDDRVRAAYADRYARLVSLKKPV
jgi:hypothetical protein